MAWEEGDLFERAEAMMDELEIDTSHLDADDPLFGGEGDSSFANLSQSVGLAAQ